MSTEGITTLDIEVSADDSSVEDIDRITRQLLSELRDLDVESAELARAGAAPGGTKAVEALTVGTIAMTVLPAVLPKVVEFVQAWATRGSGRTIKFKGKIGKDEIEFEGPPEELKKLLGQLQGRRRK